ncbi:hypothetical protein [Bordetella petrii]|uniref:hypothetical protein n=1 Tax=Bordetella petrii TaxID=94624 RepID=UPI001E535D5D|nr:hypothetical protein [Bordetella petrii]MCD0501899.1 hypothetical protein [Bordetella petrii]
MNKIDPCPGWACLPLLRTAAWTFTLAGCAAAFPARADLPGQVSHQSAVPAEAWAEGDTVRELLRVDAEAARGQPGLRQASDWIGPRSQAPADRGASASRMPDRIDVQAIYGFGKTLHADVLINGRLASYRSGRAAPMQHGTVASDEQYSLLGIDVPCVRLRKAGEPHTACLLHQDKNRE